MPQREVHHGDALAWLGAREALTGASLVTSLPDASELPALEFPAWQRWFEDAAALVASRVPDDGVAIFFQTDIREAGVWIDKGAMVSRGAERAGLSLLFHAIVCRLPPGTLTFGRPAYSHMLGFGRGARPQGAPAPARARARADVLPETGDKPGSKSMGVAACVAACKFILAETATRTVVDPFCGHGTVLAVANALGMDAVGVDISTRMVRKARALVIDLAKK